MMMTGFSRTIFPRHVRQLPLLRPLNEPQQSTRTVRKGVWEKLDLPVSYILEAW